MASWLLHYPALRCTPSLSQELHHRGVSQELAAAALRSVFGEGLDMRQHLEQMHDEDAHGQHSSSLFAGPEQMLLEGVRRQWERMARLTEEARRRRFVAWMQVRQRRLSLAALLPCAVPGLPTDACSQRIAARLSGGAEQLLSEHSWTLLFLAATGAPLGRYPRPAAPAREGGCAACHRWRALI